MKISLIVILALNFAAAAQSFNSGEKNLSEIRFLQTPPKIDGIEDEEIKSLNKRHFNVVENNGGETDSIAVTYKTAYGTEFFYIYIEVESDSVIYRDRGYQNGDGLHLVFAAPRTNGEPTDEFYVLGFTPQKKGNNSWQKKFVWYRNVDISFKRLKDTQFAVNSADGKTIYEILIPWNEISPFHPWLSESIGFNMCFVKAGGKNGKTYYYVKYDGKIQSERSPRKYETLNFENPPPGEAIQLFSALEKQNIREGERANIRIAFISGEESNLKIAYKVISGEEEVFGRSSKTIGIHSGLSIKTIPLNLSRLIPGGFRLKIEVSEAHFNTAIPFTVIPRFDSKEMMERISEIKSRVTPGSYHTLLFKLTEMNSRFAKLKRYETAAFLRVELQRFEEILSAAEKGKDALKEKKGIFRRAYLSGIDSTLQPYSIKVPRDYNPDKKYPLLVFLHGSGQDDRGVLYKSKGIKEEFIELAPRGRGTSNVYSKDYAQDDIREAIDDVIKNYSIDTTKIILSGFSMGGYGVYRTFYETPERFAALAVFSGHPDLANRWGVEGEQPNFLNEKYLSDFRNKKIFIFHGGRDRNCPIELTKELVVLLKKNGAKVTFVLEEDKGHERGSAETMERYYEWLKGIIR